jgi:hypothetical protein
MELFNNVSGTKAGTGGLLCFAPTDDRVPANEVSRTTHSPQYRVIALA